MEPKDEWRIPTERGEWRSSVAAVETRAENLERSVQNIIDALNAPTSAELDATAESPERYVRINVTKNTKGYSYETTVSLRWTDGELDAETEIKNLLDVSDEIARVEIANREATDLAAA